MLDNKDFKWTDELVSEFVNWRENLYKPVYDPIQEFKQSKQPKEDYEILEFRGTGGNGNPFTKTMSWILDNGRYKNEINLTSVGFALDQMLTQRYCVKSGSIEITKVLRHSDKEVFALKNETNLGIIDKFEVKSNGILVWCTNEKRTTWFYLEHLEKVKQRVPLFETADGVKNYEGDEYYKVTSTLTWHKRKSSKSQYYEPNYTKLCFSTKDAVDEYILNNKPLLSLNDLLSVWDSASVVSNKPEHYANSPLFILFKQLAKSKINL